MKDGFILKTEGEDPEKLISAFFTNFDYFSQEETDRILMAWKLLVSKATDKTEHYIHPLRVACILAQNKMDGDTIISALLHKIYNYGVELSEIETKFGPVVANIIRGTQKIGYFSVQKATLSQADAIRKMLFALSDDVRIILVKLADRLDRMRTLKNLEPEIQREIAEEVIDIWAPLADRLGMQSEKNELEDLSLKYSNPQAFQQIKAIVAQKQDERSAYLLNAVNAIKEKALAIGINVEITSRAKHFYSIYQKMRKRNIPAGELFDLLALRIICNTTTECYTLIGIVHEMWKPLDGRFKDYIAIPKANGYQSLHTTVMCQDRPLEIQVRTRQMHNMAEHGIASHWLYKKGTNKDKVEESKLGIFNQLQELKETGFSDNTYFNELKNELLGDEIYVFTPKGDIKKLPLGATAIDFAYAIHSAVGEKICGAKADGKIIPLSQELKNTQIIEIITNPNAHPTEAQLKIAKTSKARQKIHSWLTLNNPDFVDERVVQEEEPERKKSHKRPKGNGFTENAAPRIEKIRIGNTSNFVFSFAKCCNPKYPDHIVAYLSRMKGMVIHKTDCYVYNRIPFREERSLEVSWDEPKE